MQATVVIRELFFVNLPGSVLVKIICLAPLMVAEVKQVLCTSSVDLELLLACLVESDAEEHVTGNITNL